MKHLCRDCKYYETKLGVKKYGKVKEERNCVLFNKELLHYEDLDLYCIHFYKKIK